MVNYSPYMLLQKKGPDGVMVKTLEQTFKDESNRLKIPTDIRPYDIGYRVISKDGNILASRGYYSEPCMVRINKEWKQAEFLGIFQDAGTNLMGHPYARPVAAVKINGRLDWAALSEVKFDEEVE